VEVMFHLLPKGPVHKKRGEKHHTPEFALRILKTDVWRKVTFHKNPDRMSPRSVKKGESRSSYFPDVE
jgi:hypothetical protein